jgi:predicted permease
MLGIPLITAAFGQAGLTILLAILALHSMVLLSVATVVAEIGLHSQAPLSRVLRATLLGVLRHPIVMAVFLAFVWQALGIPVPAPMRRVLELLGGAGPPLALFCLGGSLAGFSLAGARAEVGFASFLKLALMPAWPGVPAGRWGFRLWKRRWRWWSQRYRPAPMLFFWRGVTIRASALRVLRCCFPR